VLLREKLIKRALITRARIAPGHRVLDVGCGTGTLAIAIKRIQPTAMVFGLDSDQKILSTARQKAVRASVDVSFNVSDASAISYQEASSTASCLAWSSRSSASRTNDAPRVKRTES
jgi:ubiquinone/menaquinone biosynthesis C-methylase UbiE